MASDEDDFVFFGTPIAREEEITTRKQKALAEASGQLRTLPAWKQEVTDEEGRRRFHGAFTGGYSAGYYNTVGSKEGWTPQSFTSSRKNRAEFQKQDIFNFLDEDEKAELDARSLGTNMNFDTFGFTAKELALKEAEKEQQKRPSAIPGPIPDEMVAPVTESIGVKLLLKMGWHRGRSIKKSNTTTLPDIHKESVKAFLAFSSDDTKDVECSELVESDAELVRNLSTSGDTERSSGNTPVYVLNPKQNLHGLGYDPFKHAPEFRDKRRSQASGASERLGRSSSLGNRLLGVKSGRVAPGFGIGALEDLDAEDEDVYDAGYHFEDSYVEEIEEPTRAMIDNTRRLGNIEDGILPGFKAASNSDNQLERYDPPVIPKDFVPHHTFILPYDPANKFADVAPPETLPPVDNNLKILIDGMASLVARCGKLFEDLSKEKHQANPLFGFLFGGEGHDYYAWKLWEEQQKHRHLPKQWLHAQTSQDAEKMTAESRGKILGEKPLERSITNSAASVPPTETFNLQFQLADTFIKPASHSDVPEVSKPFQDDPAKQERFEQFLKEKYHGGLRSKDAGGSSKMSEASRARERLEFEAAAEAIEKGKRIGKSNISGDLLTDVFTTSELQFTSGVQERAKVEELVKETRHPRREEFQWRPAPILCKRFDLIDPFMGKPPPAPRPRSKMDTLLFVPDPAISSKVEKGVSPDRNLSNSLMNAGDKGGDAEAEAVQEEVGNVERPVDLYKAIFSDDSDDEEENNNPNLDEDPQKKNEVVNKTVNRLIAGDFLESLGKELGLEVPPDLPYSENKVSGADMSSEIRIANQGEKEENKRLYEDKKVNKSLMIPNMAQSIQSHEHIVQEDRSLHKKDITNNIEARTRVSTVTVSEITGSKDNSKEVGIEETEEKVKAKSGRQRRHQDISESSEEDIRNRKHRRRRSRSRSRRHRSISSVSDTSDASHRHNHHSRSTRKRNKSSDDNKSSGGRHSKHRKHRHKQDSPERDLRYGSGREHREAKEKRRR